MFIISIAATTYSLVAEKQIAIAFARKELIGSKFLGDSKLNLPHRSDWQVV